MKNKIDERWICHLTEQANEGLENIFEIKVSKDLDVIIKYCLMKYKESLILETKRLKKKLMGIVYNIGGYVGFAFLQILRHT